jgi:hypothetical protein
MYGKRGWGVDLYIISRLTEFENERVVQFMLKVLDCWSDYNDAIEDKVVLKWIMVYLKEHMSENIMETLV